ncbi:MAG: SRPBCC family protein [Planctomycetes bacterium]|nr:SRPBCC family protein [Planctomycetota bacterium]
MKAIRLLLFGFLLFLGGATLLAQCQRSDWRSERARVVPAAPERVHAWLDDLAHWPALLAGENAQPMTLKLGARSKGAGAELAIDGPQGATTVALLTSDAQTGLEYRVTLPGGSNAITGRMTWTAEGEGARVTLTESGAVGWGPIERFLRGVIEEGHAEELARRLERLERALAGGPGAAQPR